MAGPIRRKIKSASRITAFVLIPILAATAVADFAIHRHGFTATSSHSFASTKSTHHNAGIDSASDQSQSSQSILTTTNSEPATSNLIETNSDTSSATMHNSPANQSTANQGQTAGPNSGGPAGPPKKITDTTVTAVDLIAPDTIYTGSPVQLKTQIRNAIGQLLPDSGHTFAYSITNGSSGGTITPNGVFSANETGFYTVQVQVDRNQAGHAILNVRPNIYPMRLTVYVSNNLIAGSSAASVLEADVVNAQRQPVQGVRVVFSTGNSSLVNAR